ncbi:hypothetical protein CO172_01955 [Candidatus Uhrbacteria bacterium CG_4_9_14_3_um_filter_36_7]|uniref:DUF4870 domain-containing protein n=1 Tax=Candidatus Uhrbacteria bacterium CG_4_9_14_3_um_filter_36_7 TaxID=1975033 RepID=A0A2M7XHK0_9BACT|nr:MAG: hypothetical protein CO172_01955 [Candidatus Uhrbacteria bacterium CG_4_9_14_3_um_filter_36_7]
MDSSSINESFSSSKPNLSWEEKIFAALSYLGVLFLIPLFFRRQSQFALFHARQGALVFVAWIVLWTVNVVPLLGQIIWFFGSIVLLIISILGIIYSLRGEEWELPILGIYAKRLKL